MWYGSTRDDIRLVHLDIEITSKCTLRCRYCANLMQYYPDELQRHEKTEDIIYGIDALMGRIGWIDEVFILGGEPFLHPDSAEIISAVAKHRNKIGYLCVASNGLSEVGAQAAAVLRETQIPVYITVYNRFSDRQTKQCRVLLADGINAELHPRTWTMSTQRVYGTPETFYKGCHRAVAPCVTLRGSKLWYCEFAANADALGCPGEHIDLSLSSPTKDELYDFLDPEKPFAACEYCSGYSDACIEAASEQCPEPMRWEA